MNLMSDNHACYQRKEKETNVQKEAEVRVSGYRVPRQEILRTAFFLPLFLWV